MGIKWGNIKRSVYMPIKGMLLQKNSAQNWGAANHITTSRRFKCVIQKWEKPLDFVA